MKSVPRDGTPILLYCHLYGGPRMIVARYNPDHPGNTGQPEPHGPFVWEPDEGSVIAERVPTHWQQLPKPPRGKQ